MFRRHGVANIRRNQKNTSKSEVKNHDTSKGGNNARKEFDPFRRQECIARAATDPDRDDKALQAEIITDYFSTMYEDRGIKQNRGNVAARNMAAIFKNID